jgi:CRISPR-associated exonuclease Cas4
MMTPVSTAPADTESTPMITPSDIVEYLYCPRFIYFMHCLNISQHEHLRYKVIKGRSLHQKREDYNRDYLRKRLGCVRRDISVYLASKSIGVRGIVDEVLHLDNGTLAPFDYKKSGYTEYTFATHKIQSVLYALLIIECYELPVEKGFICYTEGGNRVKEIVYSEGDFCYAKSIVKEIFQVILKGYYPQQTDCTNRCVDCCYRNICCA